MSDKLFEKYIERRPRCEAVELRYENVWDVARYLTSSGYDTKVSSGRDGVTLEVQRDDTVLSASVDKGDALLINGYLDIELVPGSEFRRAWEREL